MVRKYLPMVSFAMKPKYHAKISFFLSSQVCDAQVWFRNDLVGYLFVIQLWTANPTNTGIFKKLPLGDF